MLILHEEFELINEGVLGKILLHMGIASGTLGVISYLSNKIKDYLPEKEECIEFLKQAGIAGVGLIGVIVGLILLKKGYLKLRDSNKIRKLKIFNKFSISGKEKKSIMAALKQKTGNNSTINNIERNSSKKHTIKDDLRDPYIDALVVAADPSVYNTKDFDPWKYNLGD